MGSLNSLQDQGVIPRFDFFPLLAALSWGLVMFLFDRNKSSLQKSLTSSMDFLYN